MTLSASVSLESSLLAGPLNDKADVHDDDRFAAALNGSPKNCAYLKETATYNDAGYARQRITPYFRVAAREKERYRASKRAVSCPSLNNGMSTGCSLQYLDTESV
jgi:hypothetical protein